LDGENHRRQINNVSFYQQELTGEPLPNDDLDITLLNCNVGISSSHTITATGS